MNQTPEPAHLNNHHADTLTAIFQHPTSHNIRWADLVSLLEAIAEVDVRHNGKYHVVLGDQTIVLDVPHERDLVEQQVIDMRHFLQRAGYTGKEAGKED